MYGSGQHLKLDKRNWQRTKMSFRLEIENIKSKIDGLSKVDEQRKERNLSSIKKLVEALRPNYKEFKKIDN